jgi:glycosyltransferase involved in cell wall biosynthesis
MINIYVNPNRVEDYPKRGGVREHLVQLTKHLSKSSKVQLLPYRAVQMAQIQHVEATFAPVGNMLMAYCTHGGFLPIPLMSVRRNLQRADIIISVADWVANRFFKELAYKTVTIPNGVDLSEFENLPASGIEPGYVLYGKESPYFFEDFVRLALALPSQHFVTTAWPVRHPIPGNVTYVGLQTREKMKSIIKDAGLLLLTGSEVCPISLLEAWAASTPVLAKAIDGNVELMRPYVPENTEIIGGMLYSSVREAIGFIGNILHNRESYAKQGIARVESHYQWKDLVGRYENVYETMLERITA